MTKRLNSKAAIITGGASGLGRETAFLFLAHGAHVLIADRNCEAGEAMLAVASAQGIGNKLRFKRTDVTSERDIEWAIEDCLSCFGRLDCMFNNAGAVGAPGGIADTTADEWDSTFALLLRSVFIGIKHSARVMADLGKGGSIINTSSTAGMVGGSGPTAYSATKAAIISLTANAAVEFAHHRIRVNAIAPGAIRTPLIPVESDEELLAFMGGRQPWPDAGRPADIAQGALYLASEESRFCTGTTLLIDGGLLAWGPGLYPHAQMVAT